jgi:hypothetical protein
MPHAPFHQSQHQQPKPESTAETLQVAVLGDVEAYFSLPATRVHQMPAKLLETETLVLCPYFNSRWPLDSCPMGTACRLIHADTAGLKPTEVHVNIAWRSMDQVEYPRHAAGETLHVAAPNSQNPTDIMDSSCVLVTKALSSKRRPLTHCAHYYFNRQCNLGADCRFVHAVFVDPNASFRRRAPAPVQLGRGLAAAGHGEGEGRGHGADRSTPDAEHVGTGLKIVSPDSMHPGVNGGDSPVDFTPTIFDMTATSWSRGNTPMKGGLRHEPYQAMPI